MSFTYPVIKSKINPIFNNIMEGALCRTCDAVNDSAGSTPTNETDDSAMSSTSDKSLRGTANHWIVDRFPGMVSFVESQSAGVEFLLLALVDQKSSFSDGVLATRLISETLAHAGIKSEDINEDSVRILTVMIQDCYTRKWAGTSLVQQHRIHGLGAEHGVGLLSLDITIDTPLKQLPEADILKYVIGIADQVHASNAIERKNSINLWYSPLKETEGPLKNTIVRVTFMVFGSLLQHYRFVYDVKEKISDLANYMGIANRRNKLGLQSKPQAFVTASNEIPHRSIWEKGHVNLISVLSTVCSECAHLFEDGHDMYYPHSMFQTPKAITLQYQNAYTADKQVTSHGTTPRQHMDITRYIKGTYMLKKTLDSFKL